MRSRLRVARGAHVHTPRPPAVDPVIVRDGVGDGVLEIVAQLPDGRKALEIRVPHALYDDDEIQAFIRTAEAWAEKLSGAARPPLTVLS